MSGHKNNYLLKEKSKNRKVYLKTWGVTVLFLISLIPVPSFAQPLAEGKDKFLGCSMSYTESRFVNYWNQVTPGNAGKWGSVESSQDSYNWTPLDNIYNFALENGILYKHHTMVWGQQQPGWITSLDSADQRAQIEEWFQLVGERYPDMDFVDVVNEPLHAPPDYKQALGGDGATGWDWVITSFELARQYLSADVKLIINEYNVLHSNSTTDEYLEIINLLIDRDLIDGIGIQGHYFEFKGSGYTYSLTTIENNLNRLIDTGLDFYITEFDINEEDDQVQLENMQTYFSIFWENPGVRGITFWGYLIDDVWKPNAYLLDVRYAPRPAMEWLRNYMYSPDKPELIYPAAGASGLERNPILVWSSSETATSYHVQVSANSIFSTMRVDTTVTDTLLQLEPLSAGFRYYWRVSAINDIVESSFSEYLLFTTGNEIVDIEENKNIPSDFQLFQNYPNPFNPETNIAFSIPVQANVKIQVMNTLGETVKVLTDQTFSAGRHEVRFNASDLSTGFSGGGCASGVYFYSIQSGDYFEVKKLVLMK